MRTSRELKHIRTAAIVCGIGHFALVAALFATRHPWIGALTYALGFAVAMWLATTRNLTMSSFMEVFWMGFVGAVIVITDIFMVSDYGRAEEMSVHEYFGLTLARTLVWCKYLPGLIMLFLGYAELFAPPDWRTP